jgi:hypothetical protein
LVHASARARNAVDAVTFRPPRALGVGVGLAFAAWALLFGALAGRAASAGPAEFKTFLAWVVCAALIALALAFLNWTYGVFSLAYVVQHDTLIIRWGFRRVVIPLDSVLRMVPGRTMDAAHIHGLNWWGCHIGHADVKRIGYTLFYSTHKAPEELIYIHTTQESYALTILDQARFAEEVQSRIALGTQQLAHPQRSAASGLAALPFWRDGHAIVAAAVSVVACMLLCGYVFLQYPDLPAIIQINFPASGGIVRVGDKDELLKIAYAGLGVMTLNLLLGVAVHTRERAAGLWLFAAGGMVQLLLLAAAISAFERS